MTWKHLCIVTNCKPKCRYPMRSHSNPDCPFHSKYSPGPCRSNLSSQPKMNIDSFNRYNWSSPRTRSNTFRTLLYLEFSLLLYDFPSKFRDKKIRDFSEVIGTLVIRILRSTFVHCYKIHSMKEVCSDVYACKAY
jgi:hypothetical protein